MKIVKGKEYYSLYEYLGSPAGPTLGDEVNKVAIKQKQKYVTQEVNMKTYKGEVFCYTKEFLKEYFDFKEKILTQVKPVEDIDEDILPF